MKKKATTIEEGSCSRIARPQKALDRRAQSRPSSTAPPKKKRGDVMASVVADFKFGMSIYQVATKYRNRVETVEQIIREVMRLQS